MAVIFTCTFLHIDSHYDSVHNSVHNSMHNSVHNILHKNVHNCLQKLPYKKNGKEELCAINGPSYN